MTDPTPEQDWVAALASLQDPPKDGHVNAGQRRYNYLLLPDLLAEVRTKLGAHRWAFTQEPFIEDGQLNLWTTFWHTSGTQRTFGPMAMPAGRDPQSIGSVLTYLRRYSLATYCGLAGSDDDDAQQAQPAPPQARRTPAQDRAAHGQTRPVERAQARPDDPANAAWTTPRPVAHTERADAGAPSRTNPASAASTRLLWVLLRKTQLPEAEVRAWVTKVLPEVGDDWHTNTLTQEQVSLLINRLKEVFPDESSQPEADRG